MGASVRRRKCPFLFVGETLFFLTTMLCWSRLLRLGSSFRPAPDIGIRCPRRRISVSTITTSEFPTRTTRQQLFHHKERLSTARLFHSSLTSSDAAGVEKIIDRTKDQYEQDDNNWNVASMNAAVEKVTILEQSDHYVVVAKPPSVICHHSDWAGSRRGGKNNTNNDIPEIPMLQRVRDALGGQRVNLVHRLDRGASGCLLLTYAVADDAANDDNNDESSNFNQHATAILSEAMANKTLCTKTYLALVRGEGILRGRDFKAEGWFVEDRAIKNENGVEKDATTAFRFVAGQHNDAGQSPEKARASLVLARPVTGRWHQIRKHLNGLSHPILGDSTHGSSQVNREWKAKRGMPPERTCLHLIRLQIGPTPVCPEGIDVSCPLAADMMQLLTEHLPDVLREAEPILREEGIFLSGG